MDSRLQETTFIIDFRDTLAILKENPNFTLTKGQYEDSLYFIINSMEFEIGVTLEKVADWNLNTSDLSACYAMLPTTMIDQVRTGMLELTVCLWRIFKDMNMFDIYAKADLTFPFVLTGVVNTNLILIKDNIISTNEVNLHGQHL